MPRLNTFVVQSETMRINLYSVNATALTLHGDIRTSNDLTSAWREAGLPYDEDLQGRHRHVEVLSAVAGYRLQEKAHQIQFTLSRHVHDGSDDLPWYMQFDYLCPASEGKDLRPPPREAIRNMRKIQALLGESVFSEIKSDFHFDLNYRFAPDSVETVVSIPLIKINDASFPFTHVRGLRLTKETESGVEYAIALSVVRSGVTSLNVSFHTTDALSARLPSVLMSKANGIKSKFITKKDQPS